MNSGAIGTVRGPVRASAGMQVAAAEGSMRKGSMLIGPNRCNCTGKKSGGIFPSR